MNNTSYGELCKRDRGLQLSRETLTYLEGWQKCIFQQESNYREEVSILFRINETWQDA
jgi:hypothetical protein